MKELALHILDIVQNSIRAGARQVEITIHRQPRKNRLVIKIADDGRGMTPEECQQAVDPFSTTRSTRDVGLGLALFQEAAATCDGYLEITSEPGEGTAVRAVFVEDHIDRAPLGDIPGTIRAIIALNPDLELYYRHQLGDNKFEFNTEQARERLGEVKLSNLKVLNWLEDYLAQGITSLAGGE